MMAVLSSESDVVALFSFESGDRMSQQAKLFLLLFLVIVILIIACLPHALL